MGVRADSTRDEIKKFILSSRVKIHAEAEGPYGSGSISESDLFTKLAEAAPKAGFTGTIKSSGTGRQECYRGELKKGKLHLS